MTSFDISQLLHIMKSMSLTLLSFPVAEIEFATSHLPNKVSPGAGQNVLLTIFTFISREACYKVVWKYANVATFVEINLFT